MHGSLRAYSLFNNNRREWGGMKKMMTVASVFALAGVLGASAGSVTVNMGQATGGIGMYYNHAPEDPMSGANIAYMRAQIGQGNVNGAAFAFDSTDLGYLNPMLAGNSMKSIFGDVGQFGFDLVVPGPSATIPVPVLNAVDHGGTAVGNVGQVVWAVNDYKSGGPVNPAAVPVNSLFRSVDGDINNSLTLDTFNLDNPAPKIWTVDISGTLIPDNYVHWFNPAWTDTDLSGFLAMNPVISFSGKLTYDQNLDVTHGMDFYAGNIDFTLKANTSSIPDAGSTAAMLGLAGCGLGLLRRRFMK